MSAQHFHYDSPPLWALRHHQVLNCRKPESNDSGFLRLKKSEMRAINTHSHQHLARRADVATTDVKITAKSLNISVGQ